MPDVWLSALFAGLAALVPAIGTAAVLWANARHKNRQERDRDALAQYREIADRLQRQVEALQKHLEELSDSYERLSDDRAHAQVQLSDLYGVAALMHDFAKRCAACCRRMGEDPGDVPDLPPRPSRPDRAAQEFEKRTLQHNTQILSGVRPPAPPPLGGQS